MSEVEEQERKPQSSKSPKKEEFEQDPRLGEWFPQSPGPFVKGTMPWHAYVSVSQRLAVTERLVKVVLDPNRFIHHRLPELNWFARQLEQQLYSAAKSRNEYILNLEKRLPYMERIVRTHSEWSDLGFVEGIPCTNDLEKIYNVKSTMRLPSVKFHKDKEPNEQGGVRMDLITKDKFEHHNFPLDTKNVIRVIEPERPRQRVVKTEQGDRKILAARYTNKETSDSNRMQMVFREVKPSP